MMLLPLDGRVRVLINDGFIGTCEPPLVGDVAAELGVTSKEASDSLERLEAMRAVVLEPGSRRVEMAAPFSAVPTPHVVSDGEREWFSSCAWEALALLPLLERDGKINSSCPDCGSAIELVVHEGVTEGSAVFHISVPAERWWADIRYT